VLKLADFYSLGGININSYEENNYAENGEKYEIKRNWTL
jgi:hypothetical protein